MGTLYTQYTYMGMASDNAFYAGRLVTGFIGWLPRFSVRTDCLSQSDGSENRCKPRVVRRRMNLSDLVNINHHDLSTQSELAPWCGVRNNLSAGQMICSAQE